MNSFDVIVIKGFTVFRPKVEKKLGNPSYFSIHFCFHINKFEIKQSTNSSSFYIQKAQLQIYVKREF